MTTTYKYLKDTEDKQTECICTCFVDNIIHTFIQIIVNAEISYIMIQTILVPYTPI